MPKLLSYNVKLNARSIEQKKDTCRDVKDNQLMVICIPFSYRNASSTSTDSIIQFPSEIALPANVPVGKQWQFPNITIERKMKKIGMSLVERRKYK